MSHSNSFQLSQRASTMDALRATFALPPGTSSAALTRVLASLRAGDALDGDALDGDGAPAAGTDDDTVDAADVVARRRASTSTSSASAGERRRVPLAPVSPPMRANAADARENEDVGERLARRRASTLKLEARAKEALVGELRARVRALEKENRALTHARVRATVEAGGVTSSGRGEEEAPPGDAPAALARAWGSLARVARCGNAEVGLLLKQYKSTRREKMRAYDRISQLEDELTKARQEVSVIDAFVKENIKARAAAEAIVEDDAEEKLTLRAKLKEAHAESGALRARLATQAAALESSRANERALRDATVTLEKQLVRHSMTRDKYRDACHRLEEAESDRAGLKLTLAHVEAECDMLAQLVRDMRASSGFDAQMFERAAEAALLAPRDVRDATGDTVAQSAGRDAHIAHVDMQHRDASSSEAEDDIDVPTSPATPRASSIDPDAEDFISPRIQRDRNQTAVSTPDSASSSTTFHF
jgi:hypothetical protein